MKILNNKTKFLKNLIYPKIGSFNKKYSFLHFDFMKIIPAIYIIKKGIKEKKINKNTVIIESSSGNFAYGLSLICNHYNLKLIIIGDGNIDKELKKKMKNLGVSLKLIKSSNNKNIQKIRLKRLKQEIQKYKKNYFWPKQYDNPDNYKSYIILKKYLSNKINLKKIDYLISPVGSGGNSSGFYRLIKSVNKKIELIGVDSVNSVIFGNKNGKRVLRGPGSSIYPKNVIYKFFNKIFWVSDKNAYSNAYNISSKKKFKSSPCNGAVDLVANEVLKLYPDKKVLAIFPEGSERYFDTLFNLNWMKKKNFFSNNKNLSAKKINKIGSNYKGFSYINWNNRDYKN